MPLDLEILPEICCTDLNLNRSLLCPLPVNGFDPVLIILEQHTEKFSFLGYEIKVELLLMDQFPVGRYCQCVDI